jgi:hypothetical protein
MTRTKCRLLSLIFLVFLGCQPISITPTVADSSALQSITSTDTLSESASDSGVEPEAAAEAADALEYTMEGVNLRLSAPNGWQADVMDGLLLVEHTVSMDDGSPNAGMLVYIFVPPPSEFAVLTGSGNFAYAVLNHVVRMPQRVGRDVSVTEPISFRWGDYDAAYYLLSGLDARTMVLAVAVPNADKSRPSLVVCNISVPNDREGVLRTALPFILDGLTIDGTTLEGDALQTLPDPLPFPVLQRETAWADSERVAVNFNSGD